MKMEDKKIIANFEKNARPVEMVAHLDNQEIIKLLKEIRSELKKINKEA